MKMLHGFMISFLFILVGMVAGCGGGSGDSGAVSDTGSLSVSLTDASADEYQAVYITIDEVQVHLGDGDNNWITVASPGRTYNLLELTNGVMENLGVTDLDSGLYTQMRLYLGVSPDDSLNLLNHSHPYPNYVIDKDDDEVHRLKVPSGYQSGIKLVHEFEIEAGLTVELVLDFDANKSVVKAGGSGQYLLKPTIKIVDVVNNAVINGIITDDQAVELAGVTVSAQIFNSNAADEKDEVEIYASTLTDETGNFTMYLEPGEYNIVVSAADHYPKCVTIIASLDGVYTQDFSLEPADTGTVEGDVSITNGDAFSSATLSFRQTGQCNDGLQDIEVYSIHVVPGLYDVTLPAGEYRLVAFSEDRNTHVQALVVNASATETVDIVFP